MRNRTVQFAIGCLFVGLTLGGCATNGSTITKAQVNQAYINGVKTGKSIEKAKLNRIGVEQKAVGARIVGGVYIPAHKEYVIGQHNIANDVVKHKKKVFKAKSKTKAKILPAQTINEVATTLKPIPKVDANAQAKLFETLVNNYNFREASNLYRNVISYININQIKDKYNYYETLAKYLMVKNSYKNAYDAYLKAYLSASSNPQKLKALNGAVTAANLNGNSNLEFTTWLNLGDFKLNDMQDKIGALEAYYHALKIKSTPAVNLRIANILQGMGKDQLAKAFTLKAYIMGDKNGK